MGFRRLRFFSTPNETFYRDGEHLAGWSDGNRIVISDKYLDHPMVVLHEMLHTFGYGDDPHPPVFDECGATWDSQNRAAPRIDMSRSTGGVGGTAGGLK